MSYNRETGYSDISNVDYPKLERKLERSYFIKSMLSHHKVLIVGCGAGDEAIAIWKITGANCVGIDINANVMKKLKLEIIKTSIDDFNAPEGYFDFIYCNHVLEHVDNPRIVLDKIYYLLSSGGKAYIATPNKNRILPMYWSSHVRVSIVKIVGYNLRDLYYRITNQWDNHKGAHAGFSHNEFRSMLGSCSFKFDSLPKIAIFSKIKRFETAWPIMCIPTSIKLVLHKT